MVDPGSLPLELTAPLIQRLARKGLHEPLTTIERVCLCECLLFHVDAILERRRFPRIGDRPSSADDAAGQAKAR